MGTDMRLDELLLRLLRLRLLETLRPHFEAIRAVRFAHQANP
jgi:hypothetical protein